MDIYVAGLNSARFTQYSIDMTELGHREVDPSGSQLGAGHVSGDGQRAGFIRAFTSVPDVRLHLFSSQLPP